MALTKKDKYDLTKEMLFQKFNGKCSFCGQDLGAKWHIWHIDTPVTIVNPSGDITLGNEDYENKLPACISCNSTRNNHSHSKHDRINIEQFRQALEFEFKFLSENTYYKKAVKYGIITETHQPIVFYFETLK